MCCSNARPSGQELAVARGLERNLQQTRVDLVEIDVGEVIEEAAERHGTDASIGAW